MECIKCRCVDNRSFLKCDGCERPVHSECSGLNASELKVMGLKGARLLKFYCEDCTIGVRLVPQLIKKLDDLHSEIEQMKRNSSENEVSLPGDSILKEIDERQRRANNIMIFNMPESHNDVSKAKEIIKDLIKEDVCVEKAIRAGKPNKNGIRALKIKLNSSREAEKVIKAKKDVLKGRGLYVSADLTPMQSENIAKLKLEAERRKLNGESVAFKFIRGVPSIINDHTVAKNLVN